MMSDSLAKLAALDGATRVYCGHEYTMANIGFAEAVEPGNRRLAERKAREAAKRERGEPYAPVDDRRRARHEPIPAVPRTGSDRLGGAPRGTRPRRGGRGIRRDPCLEKQLLTRDRNDARFHHSSRGPRRFGRPAAVDRRARQGTKSSSTWRSERKRCSARLLFGARPAAEALIAERGGRAVGFALFFTTFSTFLCKPGIYLEDVFVEPEHRGHGLGKALLRRLAALAVERGCGRFEWRVLDWNEPSIKFYEFLGAKLMPEWVLVRMTHPEFAAMADTP
jgi:GNAT superfamily N-acetyltransferase